MKRKGNDSEENAKNNNQFGVSLEKKFALRFSDF